MMMKSPAFDEVEISVFGPGFGEAVLVHIGSGQWIAIDSCVDRSVGGSAPLAYLRAIGVDPAAQVLAVIASHWHDDHIRGLFELLQACKVARFCFSDALSKQEFSAYIQAFNSDITTKLSSGANEFQKILRHLKETKRDWNSVSADRRILNLPAGALAHGRPCEVWTLSPSDNQYQEFLQEVINVEVIKKKTKFRAQADDPNHLSVVCQVVIGEIGLLLGADLEEANHPKKGWQAIVASKAKPQIASVLYKIPHHGSANGHYEPVWHQLLAPDPIALVTPYSRVRNPLPTPADIDRIRGFTTKGFVSAKVAKVSAKIEDKIVEKTLREASVKLSSIKLSPGRITVRWVPGKEPLITTHDGAYKL